MVKESDYFHKGMTFEERSKAIDEFVEACQKEGQQIPLWIRMQLDEEEVIPPDPELKKALEDIDKEFGVKVEKNK